MLKFQIERYEQQKSIISKIYACIGSNEYFHESISTLHKLGWKKETDNLPPKTVSDADCLLIVVKDVDVDSIDLILNKYPRAQLILLQAINGDQKTPYLTLLENHGFHILCERKHTSYLTNLGLRVDTIAANLKLSDASVQSALEKSQRRIRNLPKSTVVNLLSVDARQLLLPERFDISIKVHYGRLFRDGLSPSWREHVYKEHAVRITGPGQNICEHDGTGKSGFNQFTATFRRLLKNVTPENIPMVPVDSKWIAFDGAHRIAAAITMARNIHIAHIQADSKSIAGSVFFKETSNGHTSCPREILDEAAIEYCRIKSGLVLALIFPAVASEAHAISELEKVGRIVYRKDILLTSSAGISLLRQAYMGHAWTEDSSTDTGFMHKVKSCFPFSGVVRAVLLDGCLPSAIRPVKERIRAHYNIGNHSIHIADGDDEVLRMARVLFNENSVELLRLGLGTLPGFHRMLFSFRDWIENNNLDTELFCIDGSAVLSLLDLRECRDLDFIFHGDPEKLPETPKRVNCHNELSRYHRHPIADLAGDPRLHCWYMGIKFCTPHIVLEMKERRGENKDFIDADLLRSKLPRQQSRVLKRLKIQIMWVQAYCRIRFALALNHLKRPIRPLVRKFRQYRENK